MAVPVIVAVIMPVVMPAVGAVHMGLGLGCVRMIRMTMFVAVPMSM